MASILPFDNATINSVDIAASEFVNSSGTLTEQGSDKSVTTADGRIHNIRESINSQAQFECYGDQTSLDSGTGTGVTCALKDGETTIKTMTGVVTATYNAGNNSTSISITGDS